VGILVGRYCNRIIDRVEYIMINNILLWIQRWSGQLNSWAWTKWDYRNRGKWKTWIKGYKKWKDK